MKALALCVLLLSISCIQAPPPASVAPEADYQAMELLGWPVFVAKELKSDPLWPEVHDEAEAQLRRLRKVLPPAFLLELQKTRIFLELHRGESPCAVYHPNPEWLRQHGADPLLAKAVQVTDARHFLDWTRNQPSMLLHELAHSYHDRVLSFNNPEIAALYAQAKAGGHYDAVLHTGSTKAVPHYALNNPQEYFAEGIEAYFGCNDFYPFVRSELRQADPALHEWIRSHLEATPRR